MDSKLTVGIADMKLLQGSGILITYALGSCIGLCFHDPRLHLGALLHVMLPLNMEAGRKNPMKYADTARHCARWRPRAPPAAGSP